MVETLCYFFLGRLGVHVLDLNNLVGLVAFSAFDEDADLDVLDHPLLSFAYYMVRTASKQLNASVILSTVNFCDHCGFI